MLFCPVVCRCDVGYPRILDGPLPGPFPLSALEEAHGRFYGWLRCSFGQPSRGAPRGASAGLPPGGGGRAPSGGRLSDILIGRLVGSVPRARLSPSSAECRCPARTGKRMTCGLHAEGILSRGDMCACVPPGLRVGVMSKPGVAPNHLDDRLKWGQPGSRPAVNAEASAVEIRSTVLSPKSSALNGGLYTLKTLPCGRFPSTEPPPLISDDFLNGQNFIVRRSIGIFANRVTPFTRRIRPPSLAKSLKKDVGSLTCGCLKDDTVSHSCRGRNDDDCDSRPSPALQPSIC
jgi:hypothetical protein